MSILSSWKDSRMAGHHSATSSGLESTESLISSLASDQITPLTSPTSSEGDSKMRTPRDILEASRRLGQVIAPSLRGDLDSTPTRPPKQPHHRANSQLTGNDEAGYEADGDGDGEADTDADSDRGVKESTRAGGARVPLGRPVCRPAFLRVDTRQHRRVASMLATRPGYTFRDVDAPRPRRTGGKLAALTSVRLSKPTTMTTSTAGDDNSNATEAECYELRRRPKAEPVGLGIGFPEDHPLRSRAFSMPVPHSVSPIFDPDEPQVEERKERVMGQGQGQGREWPAQGGVYEPSLARTAKLRPTPLEVSPSLIGSLPA